MSNQFKERDGRVKALLDGKEYFNHLLQELENAKTSIYIADWVFFAELYLKRGLPLEDYKKSKHRLDILFLKKAEEGVNI